MGVNVAHYIVAGVEIPYKQFEYEQLEPHHVSAWKRQSGFKVIYDGMSGKYVFAGHILASTAEDYDWFGNEPVDLNLTQEKIAEIKKDLKEKLGIEAEEIKLFAITHHS